MLTVGSRGLYEWLVTDQQFDLLQICPEVVLGKYIAITSIDSGPLVPKWYIFDNPSDLGTSHLGENIFEVPPQQGHVNVFVNYCFALHRPEVKDLATLFWQQIARIRPESYIADNDYLNFVSMNKTLFASVRDAVKALGPD